MSGFMAVDVVALNRVCLKIEELRNGEWRIYSDVELVEVYGNERS